MPPNVENFSDFATELLPVSPVADEPVASPSPRFRSNHGLKYSGQSHLDFRRPLSRINPHALLTQDFELREWAIAACTGVAYLLIGILCLSLSRFDATLASVWLPNALAVAVLFLARLRNELPAFIAIGVASWSANFFTGTPWLMATVFTVANIASIFVSTWLTRRECGAVPDLSRLRHLSQFLKVGGIIAPLIGTMIAAPIIGHDVASVASGAIAWFLAEAMGSILVVPVVLLVAQSLQHKRRNVNASLLEASVIASAGLAFAFLFFTQEHYPLLFLVPLVTLLVALKADALSSALFVAGLALLVCVATFEGIGRFASADFNELAKSHLVQAFIAANFLIGPPIAAILANRQQINEELARRQREVDVLTDGITDAVLTLDMEGVCTYASPSVSNVLDRPPNDILGQKVTDRTHEEASDSIANALNVLLSGESDHERFTYRRLLDKEDGSPVFIEADCAVAYDEETGKRSRIIVAARDITERVELELELTRARREAENATTAKTEFLANMSHEIRTPMNGVLGFAELLREGDLADESRRHADMIVQSGRSLMMLLNDILDLSKIESGQVGIACEPVDIFATISDCAALFRPTAEKKGLQLNFSISEAAASLTKAGVECGTDPWIKTDGLRLRQIVLHLLGNAVKFTEKGTVHIAVTADANEISIIVTDTGIGISKQRLKTIFAPFTQGESDTTRNYGGTGLGLTISRQLAELLGGTIEVESDAGFGSCFTLTLPATYTDAPLEDVEDENAFEPSMLPQQASILLVEDHDVNRMLATEMLERCGQSVASAHDGNEAIAMVIDSIMRGKPYDLVLMDIQMPGCDGYSATRAIRAEGITPDELPIIALTANAFPEDLATARDAGMQTLLAKPLVFADLARTLQRWLPTRIIDNDEPLDEDNMDDSPLDSRPSIQSAKNREDDFDDKLHPDFDEELSDLITTQIVDISRDPNARPPKIGEALSQPAESGDRQSESTASLPLHSHSPAIIRRWEKRRREAVEAVRTALENGTLSNEDGATEACQELAGIIHKLAGTAAIFGEAELGDQAAALENALRMRLPPEVRETLAFELLSVADDPTDSMAQLEE